MLRLLVLCLGFLSALPEARAGGLEVVLKRVAAEAARGTDPVVIFDLDDTLFETRPRTARILRELAEEPEIRAGFPNAAARLAETTPEETRYELADTFASLGIEDTTLLAKAKPYWAERFFSSRYCARDRVVPGAPGFVSAVASAGGRVIYLTGRDTAGMGEGTRLALVRRGFPTGPGTKLLMKPDKAMDDLEFKKRAFAWVAAQGKVVAGFENEPRNINAMAAEFPDATMVFLETIHSSRPDVPAPGIYHERNFRSVTDTDNER
jgi:hypothetical protein